MKLYSYWRSSTSYRVRAALNLKGVDYEIEPIDLLAGEQHSNRYLALNPCAGVPSLELEDGTIIPQSLAIMDYIDAMWPAPSLIPQDPRARARVLAAAHTIALDVHPVNNTRVIGELKDRFEADAEQCEDWMRYWMAKGFEAVSKMVTSESRFAFGDEPGLADLCIVAQAYNAHRWNLDLSPFPIIARIEQACLEVPAIAAAHPDNQPEAQEVA